MQGGKGKANKNGVYDPTESEHLQVQVQRMVFISVAWRIVISVKISRELSRMATWRILRRP